MCAHLRNSLTRAFSSALGRGAGSSLRSRRPPLATGDAGTLSPAGDGFEISIAVPVASRVWVCSFANQSDTPGVTPANLRSDISFP